MKSGAKQLLADFLNEFSAVNKGLVEADCDALQKKYSELFAAESAVATANVLVKQKNFIDLEDLTISLEKIVKLKNAVTFLCFLLEKNSVEAEQTRLYAQFHIFNAILKLQHDMLMVFANPQKYIATGRYRQTFSELKQVDSMLISMSWEMLCYLENPNKLTGIKFTKFYEDFRMAISACILNGILNRSKYGLLLNLVEQCENAKKIEATCHEQLKKTEENLKNFCAKTSAKYGILKKKLEEGKKEIQGVLQGLVNPVYPTSTSVMLEQLEDILENSKRAYPMLSFEEWAAFLEERFERLQLAFEEERVDKTLVKEVLEILPSINISITNPRKAILLFTHAKNICIELMKREKSKKESNGMQSVIQSNLVLENLEMLIRQYIAKINEFLNLADELEAYDLIVDILESPLNLENRETLHVVFTKHREKYFSDITKTNQTITILLNIVEKDRRFCSSAHFQILYFIRIVMPADVIRGNTRFLALFEQQLLTRSSQLLSQWQQCQVLEGYYHQLKDAIYISMEIGGECENWLTENGCSYDQLWFLNISIEHAEFLLALGHWSGFCQKIELIEARLARCRPTKELTEKVAQLKQQAHEKLSKDGVLYQCLVEFQIKLERIKLEIVSDKLVRSITDQVPFTTPLMILEDIIDEKDFTLAAAESLIIAFDYVNEEAFRYERRLFFAQLCGLFAEYRRVLIQNNNSGTKQLVGEKISYLLNVAWVIYEMEPEIGVRDDVGNACVTFIEKTAATSWSQLDSKIPSIIQLFQSTLFSNRKNMVTALQQMPQFMHPKTTLVTDIKVLHVLLKVAEEYKTIFGRMDAIREQLILSLFRVLCNHLILTSVAIHEKKIENYVEAISDIENSMALLERYMPIFQKVHPCFAVEATSPNLLSLWKNLKSLCDVYMMYGVVSVMQVQFKKAQQAVKKTELYIEKLKKTMQTQQQVIIVAQLEQYCSEVKSYWSNGKAKETALPGKALQHFILCEKQTSTILAKVDSAEFGMRDKVDEIPSPDPLRPFAGFVRLVDTFMEIPDCSVTAIKPQLVEVIRLFKEYQNIFEKLTSPETESLCVVELLSQKLNTFIPRLQAACVNLPDGEEIISSVARLGMLLSETRIEEDTVKVVALSPAITVKLEPKTPLVQFNREAQLLRIPPSITEDNPKIQDLLTEAAAITANVDSLEHYYLYDSYKEFFVTNSAVLALAKGAIKRISSLKSDEKKDKQQNINLMHFILYYFSHQLSTNPKIKLVCLELLWTNLASLLGNGILECLSGKIAIGQCQQALEHYRLQRGLYEYYLLQAEIASDEKRFLRLETQLFQMIENQEQSTASVRAMLFSFKTKLEQFIAQVNDNFELNVITGRVSFAKRIRTLTEFSKESLEQIEQYFDVIKEPDVRKKPIDFLKELSNIFSFWVQKNKKNQIEDFGARLLTESFQTVVDYISQAIVQIKLTARRDLQLAEKTVVAELEKMSLAEDAKPLFLSGGFNQILAVFRGCPQVKECYLVGGAIRDVLLNLTVNDYDFYVKCDPALFVSHFVDAYQPAPHKRPELFRLRHLEQQGIRHDIVCTLGECPYEADLTINSFLWDGRTLHDPFGCLQDLRAPVLRRRGDSATEFKKDPTKILRTIRLSNHTSKGIPADEMAALIEQAGNVTSLEIGLYLANLVPLFVRSLEQAHLNVNFIIHYNILNCLLPKPLCDDPTFVHWVKNGSYLHNSLFQLFIRHMTPHGAIFNEDTKYELLAIFLLPVLLGRQPNVENHIEKISEVVDEYCLAYQGFAKDKGGSFKLRFKVKSFLSSALKLYPLPKAPSSQVKM